MRIVTGIILLPLFCLIVIILTGILIWIIVKRGSHTVQDYLESQESTPRETDSSNANNRWARGELLSESTGTPSAKPVTVCPACGADNPEGESRCQSCGQPL